MAFYQEWAPYVPVAKRRANAAREASKLSKKGQKLRPILIQSKAIATSFWGRAWCENLEVYADWANRMPRGRAYARNGSIVDLQIESGEITALVRGSSLYKIKIFIDPLNKKGWAAIRSDCAQQIGSLLELMRGKLPDVVLARLTDPKQGIFPNPKEIKLQCSCPDYATMCKHIAATLYGVGHLLDSEPELFFKMRGVDQAELVSDAMSTQTAGDAMGLNQESDLAGEDLGAIFGIELATPSAEKKASRKAKPQKGVAKRRSNATKAASTKKAKPTPKLGEKEVDKKKTATKAVKKATAKSAKQSSKVPVVKSSKKRVAVSKKSKKASSKQAKRKP